MFDFGKVDTSDNYDLLPTGEYKVLCTKAEWKGPNDKGSEYISVQFKVIGEEHNGRVLFHMFNLINSNNQAVSIAMAQYAKFMEINGVSKESLSGKQKHEYIALLLDKTATVKVGVQKGKDGYEDRNSIKAFLKKLGGQNNPSLFSKNEEVPF